MSSHAQGGPFQGEAGDGAQAADAGGALATARGHAARARAGVADATRHWVACALDCYRALGAFEFGRVAEAVSLANEAVTEIIAAIERRYPDSWPCGLMRVDGVSFSVELPDFATSPAPLRIRRALEVPLGVLTGERHTRAGLGVPLAALSLAQDNAARGGHALSSGSFHDLTGWISPSDDGEVEARLLLVAPSRKKDVSVGARRIPLASDSSAAYAWAIRLSKLERTGLWALAGGGQVARRAGLYMLEDYDARKRPLVMIHGLGSQPLIWAHLSNMIWGDEDLRSRFQIWQVMYETDVPLLAARRRVQRYLDEAWAGVDQSGAEKAAADTVLIGHSLGGVIARLLCSASGETLWDTAFVKPVSSLDMDERDRQVLSDIFLFKEYTGVARAVFLAAPHRGSPTAAAWLGRALGELVTGDSDEVRALRRVALANPEAVQPALRNAFLTGDINSIHTLRPDQPIRVAVESLMPSPGFPYHTIAGVLPSSHSPTDGVVPLDSALLPGAMSSLVVESGHRLLGNRRVIGEVLRILRL